MLAHFTGIGAQNLCTMGCGHEVLCPETEALMAMLHVVNPDEEDEEDKLRKVSSFLKFFKQKCKDLYQPFQHVAVDERMVKSKHRPGIWQYIKNKPTKWGIKLWVLADSLNGYTCES